MLLITRPDLMDRRPGWGSGRRNATTIYLDPLPAAAVAAMLEDLVPGLPAPVKDRIVAQAEGIPLYAIETIRALIDRDHIVPREGVYTLVADLAELASLTVPATLTSLIAARLDSLPLESRSLVRSLSVFRGTFPRSAAGAVSGLSDDDLDALLADLVHRDVFSVRADPRYRSEGSTASPRPCSGPSPTRRSPRSSARPCTSPRPHTSGPRSPTTATRSSTSSPRTTPKPWARPSVTPTR